MKIVTLQEAWSGQADCRSCTLRTSVLFAGLEERDFHSIHTPINQYTLPPHAVLYRAGDPGEYMFTIRSGVVKLVQYLPDGSQRIVRLARRTDVIGLECLVEPRYRHDVIVLRRTQVCRYPVTVVRQLSRLNPTLHQELMRRWQLALTEADAWLTELSTGSARQRVARLLLRLADGHPEADCDLFGREDLGAMLGITTETASRTTAEFKRQGLLGDFHSHRCRLDLDGLREIAED
jgi:CRP-like cAMP-binding protein